MDELDIYLDKNAKIKEYARLHEVVKEKRIIIITCEVSLQHEHYYTNILINVDNNFIITSIPDFKLFISELEVFYVDETAKFVELKTKKGEKGIIKSLKIKNTNIYISKAEAKVIIRESNIIERRSKYADSRDLERCERSDYWYKLLRECNIIKVG